MTAEDSDSGTGRCGVGPGRGTHFPPGAAPAAPGSCLRGCWTFRATTPLDLRSALCSQRTRISASCLHSSALLLPHTSFDIRK